MSENFPGDEKKEQLGCKVARMAEVCREEDLTLQELADRIDGNAYLLLTFVISLPFCQPVPLAGLSTPMGILLGWFGFRMMLGKELRLPARMRRTVIPKKFFPSVLKTTAKLLLWIEKHLHGEWREFAELPWVRRVTGANIVFCAILLALPLPLPFSNVFPAVPIALSAAALLENDGKMLMRAGIAALANIVFWGTWTALIVVYGWPTVRGWFA